MRKQNVIIFSSFKSLEIVRRLCAELNKSNRVNAINWNSYFEAVYTKEYSEQKSYPLFCFLTKRIPSFDFAIVVAGKDDMLPPEDRKNPQDEYRMRDNVIFELGMCCMALGESRVILLRHKNVRLFADLRGNTADQHFQIRNKISAVHSLCFFLQRCCIECFQFLMRSAVSVKLLNIQVNVHIMLLHG